MFAQKSNQAQVEGTNDRVRKQEHLIPGIQVLDS